MFLQVISHYLTWLWKSQPSHCYKYFDISQHDISIYQTVFLNSIGLVDLFCAELAQSQVFCFSVDSHSCYSFTHFRLKLLLYVKICISSVSSINENLLLAIVSHCKVLYKRKTFDLWEQFIHLQELFTTKPSLAGRVYELSWSYCKSPI